MCKSSNLQLEEYNYKILLILPHEYWYYKILPMLNSYIRYHHVKFWLNEYKNKTSPFVKLSPTNNNYYKNLTYSKFFFFCFINPKL